MRWVELARTGVRLGRFLARLLEGADEIRIRRHGEELEISTITGTSSATVTRPGERWALSASGRLRYLTPETTTPEP